MAKTVVVGGVCVVTSDHTLEDIAMVEKYRPDALCVKSEDGEKVLFKVATTSCANGMMNSKGALFGSTTHDGTNKACITMQLDFDGDDLKDQLADFFGRGIMYLNQIENNLNGVIEEIRNERNTIKDSITLM